MIRGDRVRHRRKTLRMTQLDVAHAVGISQGFLSQVEAGQRAVSTTTLVDLAQTLKTSVEYLLGLDQSDDKNTPLKPAGVAAP